MTYSTVEGLIKPHEVEWAMCKKKHEYCSKCWKECPDCAIHSKKLVDITQTTFY